MEFILSQEVFVIECEKVSSFFSVRISRVIDKEISISVMESVIIIIVKHSSLLINDMSPHLLFSSVTLEIVKSLDKTFTLLKTIAVNESFIRVFLSVSESDLACLRINLRNIVSIGSRPRLNLSGNSSAFKLKILDVSVRATEIALREDELIGLGDEGHLIVDFIVLKELDDSSSIEVTNND
jgi:hypothetical protein